MSKGEPLTGRCACGAVRYQLLSSPFDAGYCHCRICQLSSGAPVMAFATVLVADFAVTRGKVGRRRSSDFGARGFCKDCGTPLTMQVTHQRDTIDFTVATLDRPELVSPGFDIWHGSRVA